MENYLRNNYNPKKGLGAPRKQTSKKPYRFAHTAGSKKGLGDYYGTGVRAKLGTMRSGMGMQTLSSKQLKKPPRSLA
jgi:hypothetical protein